MRILIISHSYYPANNPRAFRWTAIAEHWASQGIEVDVVCAFSQGDLEPFEKVNNVSVHRVKDPSQFLRNPAVEKNDKALISLKNKQKQNRTDGMKSTLYDLMKTAVSLIRWPDRDWLWIPRAYIYAKGLAKNGQYDGMITVSHPYSSHLIGKKIKKRFPSVKWLVDIGDPFAFAVEMPMNNFCLYRKLNYISEKTVFEQADSVSVTNERTAERYIEFFGQHNSKKIHIIGPLIEFDLLSIQLNSSIKKSDEISLMFAGNLINPVRKPDIFLSWALGLLIAWNGRKPKMFFDIYGDSAIDLQKYLPMGKYFECLRLHGQVAKKDVVDAMKRADILINCGNITDYQLPSKIYEYMATGKPIINFVLNPRDTSLHAMRNYPSVLNVLAGDTDHEAVIRFMESQISQPVLENPDKCIDILQPYSTSSIADRYLEVLR